MAYENEETRRVVAAIAATKEHAPDHWKEVLRRRTVRTTNEMGGARYLLKKAKQLEQLLLKAEWTRDWRVDRRTGRESVWFQAPLCGRGPVANVADLPEEAKVYFMSPGTGKYQKNEWVLWCSGPRVVGCQEDYTTIVLIQREELELVGDVTPGNPAHFPPPLGGNDDQEIGTSLGLTGYHSFNYQEFVGRIVEEKWRKPPQRRIYLTEEERIRFGQGGHIAYVE